MSELVKGLCNVEEYGRAVSFFFKVLIYRIDNSMDLLNVATQTGDQALNGFPPRRAYALHH